MIQIVLLALRSVLPVRIASESAHAQNDAVTSGERQKHVSLDSPGRNQRSNVEPNRKLTKAVAA